MNETRRPRRSRKALTATAAALLAMTVAGLLLRWTLRDRLFPFSVLFYVARLPVLAMVAVLACVTAMLAGRKRQAAASTALALVAVVLSLLTCIGAGPATRDGNRPTDANAPLRVLLWNVCRGQFGWDGVTDDIRRFDADIVALVEVRSEAENRDFWVRRFPNHSLSVVDDGMVLLAKGPIARLAHHNLSGGKAHVYRVTLPQKPPVLMVLTDIDARPLSDRKVPLTALASVAAPLADEPTLVLGDLNTPSDSVWLEGLAEHYRNAFDVAGEGWRPTWPTVVPVLDLDQFWVSQGINVISCRGRWSAHSDHRPVVLTFQPPTSGHERPVNRASTAEVEAKDETPPRRRGSLIRSQEGRAGGSARCR